MSAPAAEIAVARTKVKQALAACRTAAQRLAQAQDLDVHASLTCASGRDADRARALVELALTEHDQVEIVVLASPKQ